MADGVPRPFTRCSKCLVEVPFENLTLHELRCKSVRAPESIDQPHVGRAASGTPSINEEASGTPAVDVVAPVEIQGSPLPTLIEDAVLPPGFEQVGTIQASPAPTASRRRAGTSFVIPASALRPQRAAPPSASSSAQRPSVSSVSATQQGACGFSATSQAQHSVSRQPPPASSTGSAPSVRGRLTYGQFPQPLAVSQQGAAQQQRPSLPQQGRVTLASPLSNIVMPATSANPVLAQVSPGVQVDMRASGGGFMHRLGQVLSLTGGQQRDGGVVGGGGQPAAAVADVPVDLGSAASMRRRYAEQQQASRSLVGYPGGVGVTTSSSASSSSPPARAETSAFQFPQPPAPGQVAQRQQQQMQAQVQHARQMQHAAAIHQQLLQEQQQRFLWLEAQRRRELAARGLVAAEGALIATALVPRQNSAEEAALQASRAEFVRMLPTHVVSADQLSTATEHDRSWVRKTCAVCMECFEPGETVKTLPCFHLFHQACVDEWLVMRGTCPNCKHSLDVAAPR